MPSQKLDVDPERPHANMCEGFQGQHHENNLRMGQPYEQVKRHTVLEMSVLILALHDMCESSSHQPQLSMPTDQARLKHLVPSHRCSIANNLQLGG